MTNLLAGLASAVPNIINPGAVAYTQTTGVVSRRVGYCMGGLFILIVLLTKVSGLPSTIPGPVMAGYLIVLSGGLFVEGARTVIQSEHKLAKGIGGRGMLWIGAAFQFGLFSLPNVGTVWGALLKNGITTWELAVVVMILYLEFTNPRRMRFQSRLHLGALPGLNEFIARFATRRGWDDAMKERLSTVAEETLLTLAPMDLEGLEIDEETVDTREQRRLAVLVSGGGQVADLKFIGGGGEGNIEDQVRQLQQHDTEYPAENELSLRLLRSFASSVRHQQYRDTDIITVKVVSPGTQ